jgi:probable phosphoglycerate mutase
VTKTTTLLNRRVYIIRHGQTDWNTERRWQGTIDTPLNDLGRKQASLLADHMWRHHHVDQVYTSDLSRAYDTAKVIAERFKMQPIVDTRLREINVGKFGGFTAVELDAQYPNEIAQYRTGDLHYVIPGGESRSQVQQRGVAAFHDILANTSGSVALVSHGVWIWALLTKLIPTLDKQFHIENTSVTTLVERDETWHLASLSVTAHL